MASCKRPAGQLKIRRRASSSADGRCPYFDQAFGEELDRVFKEKFDLLLGRKTYEIFAAYWPYYDDASHGGIAKLFNDIEKYAVSRSGEVDGAHQVGVEGLSP